MCFSDEEYAFTQQRLILIAGFCHNLQLDAFLDRISLSEGLGPILNPTLFLKACDKIEDVKSLAQSLRPFQQEVLRQLSAKKFERKRNGKKRKNCS